MREGHDLGRLLAAISSLALAGAASAVACGAGTVTDQVATGTVKVEYETEDSLGNPVHVEAILIRPTRFIASIIESVTRDPSTRIHTYRYIVRNDPSSEQQVGTVEFAIPPNVPVTGFGLEADSPGWTFFPESNPDGGFSWAFMVGTPRPDLTIEGIPQGSQASFWFESPWAPGPVRAYLRGVEPPVVLTPPLPGCVEDAVLDITGFPRDYVPMAVTGPAISP